MTSEEPSALVAPRGERARLFVALEVPGDVVGELVRWRSSAVAGSGRLRLPGPEHLHVTLCFLGWQPADQVTRVAGACGRLAGARRVRVALGEPVWLPPRRPRVLAVRLDDPDGRLAHLQAQLSAILAGEGWYTPERRPYMPHVTVARAGQAQAGRAQAGRAQAGRAQAGRAAKLSSPAPPAPPALPAPPPALAFTASRVTLFRSRLSPAGARYEPLASVELGAA